MIRNASPAPLSGALAAGLLLCLSAVGPVRSADQAPHDPPPRQDSDRGYDADSDMRGDDPHPGAAMETPAEGPQEEEAPVDVDDPDETEIPGEADDPDRQTVPPATEESAAGAGTSPSPPADAAEPAADEPAPGAPSPPGDAEPAAVDAAEPGAEASSGEAERPADTSQPRPEAEAPGTTPVVEDDELPIAGEDGVLPGEPGDEPGVGLPVESADGTADPDDAAPEGSVPPGEIPADPAPETGITPPALPDVQQPLFLLGTEVPPGAIDWLSWSASESFEGISTPTPVLVVNGTSPGPTLCLTAAVHGDELNGVEMVRRIMYSLEPQKLSGAVIGAPIVNLHGFRRSSRYLPDRRDLNRYFPGSPTGSSASRIAHSFFHEVIVNCDALVDVHTGSFHRANLPQIRADLNQPEVVELTQGFGATVVLHSAGGRGTLRRAATDAGIPAVTLETGEPMRLQPKEVAHGVKGIETLLDKLGMVNKVSLWGDPQPVYYEARWIRANSGGILFSNVNLGERIRKGEVLGTVTDPITNKRSEIRSRYDGRLIGRALNQVVMPGFAAFHVGIQTSEEQRGARPAAATADATASDPEGDGQSSAADAGAPDPDAEEESEDQGYYEEEERPE